MQHAAEGMRRPDVGDPEDDRVGIESTTDGFNRRQRLPKIMKVIPRSPAGWLQPGDVLYALNGVRIAQENYAALTKAERNGSRGSPSATRSREGVDRKIALTWRPPADVMARWIGEHMKNTKPPSGLRRNGPSATDSIEKPARYLEMGRPEINASPLC
jgi:hypothetical protein